LKTTKKRKPTKKKASSSKFTTYIALTIAALLILFVILLIGYYAGYKDASKQYLKTLQTQSTNQTISYTQNLHKKLQSILEQNNINLEPKPLLKPKILPKPPTEEEKKKPKLAIIFDDVSFPSQVHDINALHLRVTMSFFPPNAIHPDTANLAALQSFYMVHLPLEAIEFHHPEPNTLNVNDSLQRIQKRIQTIKQEFPRLHYINNHTGSTFTANKQAMEKLIGVLKQNDIQFIDSRTTARTKAPQVTKEYHMRYIARDVFLDDKQDVPYIIHQLKEAIRIAKAKGYAIAIGHPHPATLQAIAASKTLLKQVHLVYVNKI
jgi:uncharacterized protein